MNRWFKLSNKGFTLVELMIVVAIIGILSTIAIPQYKKFQSRAKQSEARITLGGLQMAEAGWAVDNDSFSPCLAAIGFGRDGTKFYYAIGFDDHAGDNTCGPTGAGSCGASRWDQTGTATTTCVAADMAFAGTVADTSGAAVAVADLRTAATTIVTNSGFTGAAVGRIGGTQLDIWTIDQLKSLQNTQSGI